MTKQKKPAPPSPSPAPAPVEEPKAAPSPAPASIPDDLQASVSASLENSPVPNEAAISAHAQRQADEKAAADNDPQPKGKRKYTKRGTAPASGSFVAPGQGPDAKREEFRRAGRAMADTLILLGQTAGGEDWKPVLQMAPDGSVLYDERTTLREAWADMAEEYQISKMPPWAACAIATAAYVGPRLNAPSTISRWEKVKLWWQARKIKQADEKKAKEDKANA